MSDPTKRDEDGRGRPFVRLYIAYDANGDMCGVATKRAIKRAGLVPEIYVGHVNRADLPKDGWQTRYSPAPKTPTQDEQ
jgi:hypothetical protein